jgi:hypothetical protein
MLAGVGILNARPKLEPGEALAALSGKQSAESFDGH